MINLDFCLLCATRRYVWKDRDDVNLLVNGSQYLSHALVDLSAFVNVLSYEAHAVYGSWWNGWTRDSSESRDEFNRYRDITPAVGGDRLVETLLSGLGLQSVLRNLCGIPMTLGWYCAFTPIKPVTISKEQSVFVADVWSRSRNATRNKRTIIRPSQCVIGDSISEQLIGLQTLRMSRDSLCSNLQCVEDF